ncbi:MAG: DUF4911 domain-containing protein [Nitrospina sp.]|nr:DUF4911 domain-containing protein [Nitrospina sp.]MBT3508552.1 DUF4911 domain-containing protein [Nitrospina sp.]MBT3875328.1 DUF4911 domain-containing protein [Nitrospina sp.]MBT4048587.1 DUF4911 domain-containing protein [Nitrospina sp.]MBT4559015.1 DUF4911 domain-containing protein [Nitrospina sp.]
MMHTDSIQWQIEVDKKDIAYIVSIFEGYDNLAVVRTVDASRGIIELMISPDYLEDTRRLVQSLSEEIPFRRRIAVDSEQ